MFALAAGVALWLGIAPLMGLPCDSCTAGVMGGIMPWLGALFYSVLAAIAWRSPRSPLLSWVLGLYLFAHASLITESILMNRVCVGCIVVAALALAAGLFQVFHRARDWMTLPSGLLLGVLSAFFYPYDSIDGYLTRTLWPAKILNSAPTFVDRNELAACGHVSAVRLLVYEKDCGGCGSASRRILPELARDFTKEALCVHIHKIDPSLYKNRFPLFVLMSRKMDLVVIEGMPKYSDLRTFLDGMIDRCGGGRR